MKFANIIMTREGRCTIGDDLQLLAIENLYKFMGIDYNDVVRIPFSSLATYDGEYVVLPLSFPFHGYYNGTCITNFSDRIIPVFLGFATLTQNYCEKDIEYLRKFEPIGCRDEYTLKALRKNNILSYLNGCLTATFPKTSKNIEKKKTVFCVDVPEDFVSYIPDDIKKNCVFTNHVYLSQECENGTEEKAKEVYQTYIDEARLIITTRMHAALPCIAAGIPVILAKDSMSLRFPVIKSLIPVYTKKEYASIDWNPLNVEYEGMKNKVLEVSAKRLLEAFEKYSGMMEISEFYECQEDEELFIEAYTTTVEYLAQTYKTEDEFEYALWGVTQNADMVYHYIKEHFPKAKLKAIIDKSNRAEFCGLVPTKKEWFADNENVCCFVCAGAAMPEAQKYFEEIKHDKVYYCWVDGLPR